MKKEIALVIPLSILADKELNAKDKLLYGLHYAYYKKSGETYLTNVEIATLLKLHKNRVGDGNTALVNRGLLEEVKSNFRIVESSIDKTEDCVLLPFELYHLELTPNLKLLWAEYNRFGRGEEGYYVLRVNTANNLGIKESTVSSLTTKLELLNMIECRREFGRRVNKRTIFTKDLSKIKIIIKPTRPKSKKEEKNVVNEENTSIQPKEEKSAKEDFYDRPPITIGKLPKSLKKKKKKKSKEEKELRKKELEEEKKHYLLQKKELDDIGFYEDLID